MFSFTDTNTLFDCVCIECLLHSFAFVSHSVFVHPIVSLCTAFICSHDNTFGMCRVAKG